VGVIGVDTHGGSLRKRLVGDKRVSLFVIVMSRHADNIEGGSWV
jgi:hypothetical protein